MVVVVVTDVVVVVADVVVVVADMVVVVEVGAVPGPATSISQAPSDCLVAWNQYVTPLIEPPRLLIDLPLVKKMKCPEPELSTQKSWSDPG